MGVPSGAFDASAAARQRGELELTLMRLEITVEMLRLNVSVRREFIHGGRIRCDAKAQQVRFIPNCDRFNEWTGRKHATADCARSVSSDLRANWVGNSGTKDGFLGWRNFRKRNHLLPDLFRRSVDFNRALDLKHAWLWSSEVFDSKKSRRQQDDHSENGGSVTTAPVRGLDCKAE